MLKVIKANYLNKYKISIEFSNNKKGTIDLSDTFWGSVFEPLKDTSEFKKFSISETFKTIVWQCEAYSALEYLYKILLKQEKNTA